MASPMSIPSGNDDADWVVGAAAQFDFVRFTTSDINGIPRGLITPRRYVDEKLKTGVGMCSGTFYVGFLLQISV